MCQTAFHSLRWAEISHHRNIVLKSIHIKVSQTAGQHHCVLYGTQQLWIRALTFCRQVKPSQRSSYCRWLLMLLSCRAFDTQGCEPLYQWHQEHHLLIQPINSFDQLWLFHVLHWQFKWERVVLIQVTVEVHTVQSSSVAIPEHLDLILPLPAQLDNVMDEAGPRTECKTSSVIVTSISSPSIMHSPPGFHGSLKLAKTYSPVTKDPLDIARLETTMLPWRWTKINNNSVELCMCVCGSDMHKDGQHISFSPHCTDLKPKYPGYELLSHEMEFLPQSQSWR